MSENKSDVTTEEKQQDEDKSEVLGNLVKVVVLIWSASLLTFSYVRLPNGQKILDFDPTFIASVFSGSLAAFGLSPARNGSTQRKHLQLEKKRKKMQKLINALAVLSFLGTASIIGGGVYVYLRKMPSLKASKKE